MNDYIIIPSELEGFKNTGTKEVPTTTNRRMFLLSGTLARTEEDEICPCCGARMHIHDTYDTKLRHLPFGPVFCTVRFDRHRHQCSNKECRCYRPQGIPFKADSHRITRELETYTRDLLAYGLTNVQVSMLTGLGRNTVKEIDLRRLKDKYTEDGVHLKKPERQARHLGIDEFKLHDGHRYAVVIIDLDTGHVLWLARGKKKQTVFDFIDFVGEEWMDGVEAVACDMNSDFQEAFEVRCEHIQVVFDFFHIKKNFADKVISEVRKGLQRECIANGDEEGARKLKKAKYILTSSMGTLEKHDKEAEEQKIIKKSGTIFGGEEVKRKGGKVAGYKELMEKNELLFTADLVKEKLSFAYTLTDEALMAKEITSIMDICHGTGNKHFMWFARLPDNHFEGIIAHATYRISSGKVEGCNAMIKCCRRQAYGYRDDDYFFLKIMDASRRDRSAYRKSPIFFMSLSIIANDNSLLFKNL
ncbi:MAG: ISL3 family transposase [Spirochaetia bacterium]|jgi:transposase|nr:ISL3 family transposase [Spirochaetia bacterium]